jgi:hypothetical protein
MQAHEKIINNRREILLTTYNSLHNLKIFDRDVKRIKELCLDTPGYRYIFFYYFVSGQRGVIALRNLKARLQSLKPYLNKLPKGIDTYKTWSVLKYDLDIIEKDAFHSKFIRLCPREIRLLIDEHVRSIKPSSMKQLNKREMNLSTRVELKMFLPFYKNTIQFIKLPKEIQKDFLTNISKYKSSFEELSTELKNFMLHAKNSAKYHSALQRIEEMSDHAKILYRNDKKQILLARVLNSKGLNAVCPANNWCIRSTSTFNSYAALYEERIQYVLINYTRSVSRYQRIAFTVQGIKGRYKKVYAHDSQNYNISHSVGGIVMTCVEDEKITKEVLKHIKGITSEYVEQNYKIADIRLTRSMINFLMRTTECHKILPEIFDFSTLSRNDFYNVISYHKKIGQKFEDIFDKENIKKIFENYHISLQDILSVVNQHKDFSWLLENLEDVNNKLNGRGVDISSDSVIPSIWNQHKTEPAIIQSLKLIIYMSAMSKYVTSEYVKRYENGAYYSQPWNKEYFETLIDTGITSRFKNPIFNRKTSRKYWENNKKGKPFTV